MKILIATDGSEASKSVVEAACQLIDEPENTEVKIISVVEPFMPMPVEPFAISAGYYAELQTAADKQAQIFVEQAETALKEIRPNMSNVSSEVLRGGASPTIVEAAREWGANAIVVGSHGYGFWSRTLLGSVSNSVVHHAPCTVLVVRQPKDADNQQGLE